MVDITSKRQCKCVSHCMVYNHKTRQYEGPGQEVTYATFFNHKRDDFLAYNLKDAMDTIEKGLTAHILNDATPPISSPDQPVSPPSMFTDEPQTSPLEIEVALMEQEVIVRIIHFCLSELDFVNDPIKSGPYRSPDRLADDEHHSGLYVLRPDTLANKAFLEHRTTMFQLLRDSTEASEDNHRPSLELETRLSSLRARIQNELRRLEFHKEFQWCLKSKVGPLVDTERYYQRNYSRDPVVVAVCVTVLLFHLIHRLPRRAADLLIGCQLLIVKLTKMKDEARVAAAIPKDSRTILRQYNLDPVTTTYLSCPTCFALYLVDGTHEVCTYAKPGENSCSTALWRDHRIGAKTLKVPRRKYVHQGMTHWVARLLSRPNVEDIIDNPRRQSRTDGLMTDIFDSPLFEYLRDVDGTPFVQSPPTTTEGRYIFSFAVDGFNPFHMKTAKQKVSCTGIWMVLLNFPPHLRYLPENMYLVGVIPGPNKPSIEEINHTLEIIVEDLILFRHGVSYSRTSKYSTGRRVKALVIPLVMDMLAARQVSGFGSATSDYFCTLCKLRFRDLNDLDKHNWPYRNLTEHIKAAEAWRDAPTEKDRQKLFKEHGVRWTPLLKLDYMNVILFTVPDWFHIAFLNAIQAHCREVFRIDVNVLGGDGTELDITELRPDDKAMAECLEDVIGNNMPGPGLRRLLSSQHKKNVLWHICYDKGLRVAGSKWKLAGEIVEWRRKSLGMDGDGLAETSLDGNLDGAIPEGEDPDDEVEEDVEAIDIEDVVQENERPSQHGHVNQDADHASDSDQGKKKGKASRVSATHIHVARQMAQYLPQETARTLLYKFTESLGYSASADSTGMLSSNVNTAPGDIGLTVREKQWVRKIFASLLPPPNAGGSNSFGNANKKSLQYACAVSGLTSMGNIPTLSGQLRGHWKGIDVLAEYRDLNKDDVKAQALSIATRYDQIPASHKVLLLEMHRQLEKLDLESGVLGTDTSESGTTLTADSSAEMMSLGIEDMKLTPEALGQVCLLFYRLQKQQKSRNFTAKVFQFCCAACRLPTDGTIKDMHTRLSQWVQSNVPSDLPGLLPTSRRHVLGSRLMNAVRADMVMTELPSWISRAPYDWGTSQRGKLSADQWHVIGAVHLPITLIRLWGNLAAGDRWHNMLRNFMSLVQAVKIASLRHTSPQHVQEYDAHVLAYLSTLKTLYRDVGIKPSQHVLMHIGMFLSIMGPNHSRNASPFERFIYFMQGQNTNMKFGELESTFMYTCCRSANLQALLKSDPVIADLVPQLVSNYMESLNEDVRGTRTANLIDPDNSNILGKAKEEILDLSMQTLLTQTYPLTSCGSSTTSNQSIKVRFVDRVSIRGVRYATVSSLPRDSSVIFRAEDSNLRQGSRDSRPGHIQSIFHHPGSNDGVSISSGIYLVIKEYVPASSLCKDVDDIYREFDSCGGYLCSTDVERTHIVKENQIVSHFGRTRIPFYSFLIPESLDNSVGVADCSHLVRRISLAREDFEKQSSANAQTVGILHIVNTDFELSRDVEDVKATIARCVTSGMYISSSRTSGQTKGLFEDLGAGHRPETYHKVEHHIMHVLPLDRLADSYEDSFQTSAPGGDHPLGSEGIFEGATI